MFWWWKLFLVRGQKKKSNSTPPCKPAARVKEGISMQIWRISSVVTRCADASKRVSSNGGGVSSKRGSRLASFRGGAKNDDVRSLAARLYHVTASGSGSDIAGRFDSNINPSGSIQHVGCWFGEFRERNSLESEEGRIGDKMELLRNCYF